ncbi:5-oxoprolinase subunit PxpB, partial [Escherichia coli]|uniref:5-oxoprolinase subunit PxpB n=1 Tax=Escherichia coli TaxID=562 RepID=UPI002ED27D82|nr:5-oxoprolinase subunit PxpB [Escherichia coli]
MQRARCYLIGETAVVLELEPPVTLASQKRIWRLAQRLVDMPNVVEAIPGMNNITVILRNPESLALDAIERLQRWWEESEALEPESRFIEIPVVYGGAGGPDLAVVAAHCGLSEKQVVELHSSVEYVVLMNPLMILVKIIKLRWIHILSYDQMVSRKINNQTTRCANS